MFCPKCGCILPDGSSFCNECGCRIGKHIRDSLCEDQPTTGPTRTSRSPLAIRHETLTVAGTALSLVMVASLLMEWLNPGISGLNLATSGLYIGKGFHILRFAPLAIAALGILLAAHFAFGVVPRSWVFPAGISCTALTIIFCTDVGWNFAYSAGTGAYAAVISSAAVAMLGLKDIGN